MFPAGRLEDHIRELCARASASADMDLTSLLFELQLATHEYVRRLENRTSANLLNFPELLIERRKATEPE